MPITQNKRRIKVQHVVGEGTAQIDVVRNIEITRPVIDPETGETVLEPIVVRKIADVDAELIELDYEILPNKVIVKGALHKQIFYIEEGDYVVREYTVMREEFTDFVHIEGAKPGMDALIDAQIMFIDTSASNGTFPTSTIHQAAVLSVTVKVIEILQLDVVTDVTGPGITVEKELFNVESVVGEKEKQATVSAEHTLNEDARKIYDMDAVCRDLDYEILPGKVIVRGTLHKQIYYVDNEDSSVQEQSFDDPFSVVIDIPGAEPDMDAYVKCRVEFCEANLMATNANGVSNRVKANCILQVFAKVTELIELNIVTNVKGAAFDRRRIRVENILGKKCGQENVNQSIDVNAPADVEGITVRKTRNMTARIRNVTYEKIQNKVIVKGVIHVQAYYIACEGEQELRETSADIPFTTFVHFDGITSDTMVDVTERVEYTDLKLEGESCQTANVRAIAILEICVRAFEMKEFVVVVDVKDTTGPVVPPTDECPPSGYYSYTVVAGDTYYVIAQKHQSKVPGITAADIQRANPGVDPRRLRIGQVIRIPCVVGKG